MKHAKEFADGVHKYLRDALKPLNDRVKRVEALESRITALEQAMDILIDRAERNRRA